MCVRCDVRCEIWSLARPSVEEARSPVNTVSLDRDSDGGTCGANIKADLMRARASITLDART